MALAQPAAPRVYMDALVTPNRSMSAGGLRFLFAALVAYNLLVMAFLLVIGAFPVPIFLGLDFLGLWIAFRISARRGRWAERVHVTADHVAVFRRQPPSAERAVWRSPTAFTRVVLHGAGEHNSEVWLQLSGRRMRVGAALSPGERVDFAASLRQAVEAARAERHPG